MAFEPFIKDSTPTSSVLLAYGESPRRGTFFRVAILALALAVLGGLAWGIGRTLFENIFPAPTTPTLMLALPASAHLPVGSPELWRTAQRESAPFPVIVGFALSESGSRTAFAVTLRKSPHSNQTRSWPWQLSFDEPSDATTTRLSSFASNPFSFRWLRIWPARFFGDATQLAASENFGGALDGHHWRTNLPAPDAQTSQELPKGQNFLDLSAVPNAWIFIEAMLREQGYDLRLSQTPIKTSWSLNDQGEISAQLVFTQDLDLETKARLAAAAGILGAATRTLSDGSEVQEFDLPFELLRNSTSTEWTSKDGRQVIFSQQSVILGDPSQLARGSAPSEACSGHILATFDRIGLKRLLLSLGLDLDVDIQRLVWLEEGKKLVMCWE